jgi:hypothetical protein
MKQTLLGIGENKLTIIFAGKQNSRQNNQQKKVLLQFKTGQYLFHNAVLLLTL